MVDVNKLFDAHAADYNRILAEHLGKFGGDVDYYAEYKVRMMRKRLGQVPGRILEYGCGVGRNLPHLRRYFPEAEIHGCDVSAESLAEARRACAAGKFFLVGPAGTPSRAEFDLVFVACVFHHVPVPDRFECMRQVVGWLRPGGDVFIFEENPRNPITRRIVRACPFDKEAVLLRAEEMADLAARAGLELRELAYTLFFPAALKKLAPLEAFLGALPFGAQYCVWGRKTKKGDQ